MELIKYFNANFDDLLISDMSKKFDISEKVVEILFSRGYTTEDKIEAFINPTKKCFHNPFLLKNMNRLCQRIKNIKTEKVLIFGDYDVDGIGATAIMLLTLKKLGIEADHYLPNRFIDGYGLTNEVIDKLIEKYNPNLIITVDCGISCYKEVAYAKSKGIEIIVTDHHEIPEILPEGIVLNAKMEDQEYPFKELCGTGLAYKISQALLGFEKAEEFLPIAAVSTIADIVSLTDENRAIVYFGLKLCSKYLPIGLKTLFKENGIDVKKPNEIDISFKITPKLNASGRLGEATDSLLLYLETDLVKIKEYIEKINNYNTRRQEICNDVYNDCIEMLSQKNISEEKCIILSSPKWDHGILGIVCSRLVEQFNRPVFLFTEGKDTFKGSARSIPDINVHLMLNAMSDILETFGGHTMAAGLSLMPEHYETFIRRINNYIISNISDRIFTPIRYYDADLTIEEVNPKLLADIKKLEPFGCGNNRPQFKICAGNISVAPLKNFSQHYNINFGKKLQLIYFNCSKEYFMLKYSENRQIIFEFQTDRDRGNTARGIVKYFHSGFKFNSSFSNSLDAFQFDQLKYLNATGDIRYKNYPKTEMPKFVSNLKLNCFGTLFVAFSINTYKNFISNYYLGDIYNQSIFNDAQTNGFNSIVLYPTNIDIYKQYKNIIFLDPIININYIAQINKISTATVYIPTFEKVNKKLLQGLETSREELGKLFVVLKKYNTRTFSNILELYNTIKKEIKISFPNFYFSYLIFEELKFLTFEFENSKYILKCLKDSKSQLTNSSIYNFVLCYKQQ